MMMDGGELTDTLAGSDAIHMRQHYIQQNQIHGVGREAFNSFLAIHGSKNLVTFRQEVGFEQAKVTRFIIYNQDADRHGNPFSGNIPFMSGQLNQEHGTFSRGSLD
jgi:hypothetical protein